MQPVLVYDSDRGFFAWANLAAAVASPLLGIVLGYLLSNWSAKRTRFFDKLEEAYRLTWQIDEEISEAISNAISRGTQLGLSDFLSTKRLYNELSVIVNANNLSLSDEATVSYLSFNVLVKSISQIPQQPPNPALFDSFKKSLHELQAAIANKMRRAR